MSTCPPCPNVELPWLDADVVKTRLLLCMSWARDTEEVAVCPLIDYFNYCFLSFLNLWIERRNISRPTRGGCSALGVTKLSLSRWNHRGIQDPQTDTLSLAHSQTENKRERKKKRQKPQTNLIGWNWWHRTTNETWKRTHGVTAAAN